MSQLLIFDLDGTLADTSQDITNALNYSLRPFKAGEYSVEETKKMVGSGISSLLKSLIPSNNPGDEDIVAKRFLEFYSKHLMDNTIAYPHVKETLAMLGDFRKAVLSNKREAYSKEILDQLGLSQYFETIWGSDSVREKKPSPVPILDLLDNFNVCREDAIMIGDSNFDVEAGNAAGIKVIGVTYGFRAREYLQSADVIIDSFADLVRGITDITGHL